MVKRWFLVGVMLLLAALLVVGCGIPQEEHDAVVANRDAAQAQVTTLQSDLTKAQGDIAKTQGALTKAQSDLTKAEAELASLEKSYNTAKSDLTAAQAKVSELEDSKTELGSLWDSLVPKLTLGAAILNYWNGGAKVTAGEMTESEYITECITFIGVGTVQAEATDNAEVIELWSDYISYVEQENMVEMISSLAALTDLLGDLVDQDIAAIESELSK